MSGKDGARTVISEQAAPFAFEHLLPIAKFLIEERGHMPLSRPEELGFEHMDGFQCRVTRRSTGADWAAVNERFPSADTSATPRA
jgi:hypothetical protein